MPIPIVMVLVEGGPSSVRTICQALESNTPVVVVKVEIIDGYHAFNFTSTFSLVFDQRNRVVQLISWLISMPATLKVKATTGTDTTLGLKRQRLDEVARVKLRLMPCKCATNSSGAILYRRNSFLKAQEGNNWIDEVRADLCRVLNERKQLVTIFKFDSKRHHGFLEDAILESLLNGKPTSLVRSFRHEIVAS